ncbi:DNA polymerase epsilon subunit 2 [Rhizophlyctis rosea]|uniref:DNA polymerase epsilon subunit n=1 Tax=Rhizophlyctis rosea TaxID=64517 RepID=A0AAD5S881_9FUNG|nr:DNA polymerase epsilon subunit 2 [Rhizophlyctis rosea]
MAPSLNTFIYKVLTKKHGLTLKADALKYLLEVVEESGAVSQDEVTKTLDYIAQSYFQQQGDEKLIVDRDALQEVVESFFRKANVNAVFAREDGEDGMDVDEDGMDGGRGTSVAVGDVSEYFHVIDAFEVPRWKYRPHEKIFVKKLTPIKSLHGRKPGNYVLLGMLTQMEEGKFHLEDPDDFVELDLTKQNIDKGHGIFTFNCFVVAQGVYTEDKRFRVDTLGMPVPERREKSLLAFGHNVNFFGGTYEADEEALLTKIELGMTDVSIIIISDVWLDSPKVLMKLRELFEGFSNAVHPLAFLFLGSFSSQPYLYNTSDHAQYKEGFNTLADLLSDFPTLQEQCHFIFVPGPNDPWAANILPRPGIPKYFTSRFRNKVPKAHFVSNPCRIKYCTQEIVVFREDLAHKMRRNAVVSPKENDSASQHMHLVATLLDQAYLSPLPLNVQPVYWAHDHALRLYPSPHLLILADKYEAYNVEYEGTQCINPGSFPNTEYGFMVYAPAGKIVQASQV